MDMHNLLPLLNSSPLLSVILLYAGPDQILPLMSVIGAIFGVLLVFWQRFIGLVRRVSHFFARRLRPAAKKKI
jgi:undecaprenyl pyrophosphate phosphatase UppP